MAGEHGVHLIGKTFWLIFLCLVFGTPVSAMAQVPPGKPATTVAADDTAPSATTATYGAWSLRCVRVRAPDGGEGSDSDVCEIVETVLAEGVAEPIAYLAVGPDEDSRDFRITAVLPVNVDLPGEVYLGTAAQNDAGRRNLEWKRCYAMKCFASVALSGEEIKSFSSKEADRPSGIYFVAAGGSVAQVPVSWDGFSEAFAALSAKRK